jgi:polysaccharide export outer membrane protein
MEFKKSIKYIAAVVLVAGMASCNAPKKVTYFQDIDAKAILQTAKTQPIVVRPGDKLSIIVKAKDASVSELFNMPVYSTRIGNYTSTNGTGSTTHTYTNSGTDGVACYNVSEAGNIEMPILGSIHVEGMTREEVAGYVKGEIAGRDLAKDVTVNVEFLSTGINILGEVAKPGRYDMNKDKLTIFDAISLAGDLTITGLRDKVRVLRQEGTEIHTYTLDLTNAEGCVQSPAYYLQQDDVVYVEPNDMRKRQTTVNGNNALSTSFWISVASLITTAVTTIGVFVK